jgi:hypothetical protein
MDREPMLDNAEVKEIACGEIINILCRKCMDNLQISTGRRFSHGWLELYHTIRS